jgi:hypothetical protein
VPAAGGRRWPPWVDLFASVSCATLIFRRLQYGRHVFDHKERAMSGERRSDRKANDEPSLGISVGLLCVVLFAMFAIVGNVSIPDVEFVQADFLAGL